jgi:hypothetical protein
MLKTRDVSVVRGQTLPLTFTTKDHLGARVDITGAAAYTWIRADMKVDAVVKLASAVTAGHRVGIVIADQTAEHKGEFTVTLVPADTQALVALGSDDPYLYDVWLVLADATRWPLVALSKMSLYPEATTVAP